MARTKRTLQELQAASNHLHYEVMMLEAVAGGLASGIAGQGPILNALIESFVIHVRNVMDFLYVEKPQPDDVIAEDFFDEPEQWTKNRPELSQRLKEAKRRAHKEVAHLTYARLAVTPQAKPWEFLVIRSELHTALVAFLNRVPRNRLGADWSAVLGRP